MKISLTCKIIWITLTPNIVWYGITWISFPGRMQELTPRCLQHEALTLMPITNIISSILIDLGYAWLMMAWALYLELHLELPTRSIRTILHFLTLSMRWNAEGLVSWLCAKNQTGIYSECSCFSEDVKWGPKAKFFVCH